MATKTKTASDRIVSYLSRITKGATRAQIAKGAKVNVETVSPRITELRDQGVVYVTTYDSKTRGYRYKAA